MDNLDRRTTFRLSAAAGLTALTACGRAAERPPATAGPPRLMFIRHGEEPVSGGPSGVTTDGDADARSLTVRGWTRAGALVSLFDPRDSTGKPTPVRSGLDRPTTIFAPDPGQTGSRRSLETVTPLSAALNLNVNARFTATQTAQVAESIRSTPGSILIAWKHEQIGDIITHLTGGTPPPPPWPSGRFDVIFILTRNGDGWRLDQAAQMLLAGDRPL